MFWETQGWSVRVPAKSSDISGLSPVERQVMSSCDVTSVGMVTMPTLGVQGFLQDFFKPWGRSARVEEGG